MKSHEKKRTSTIIAFVAALALTSCATKPVPPPFNPNGMAPTTCAEACQHVDQDLACQNGGACMDVCQRIESPEYALCLSASKDCAAVDLCGLQVP